MRARIWRNRSHSSALKRARGTVPAGTSCTARRLLFLIGVLCGDRSRCTCTGPRRLPGLSTSPCRTRQPGHLHLSQPCLRLGSRQLALQGEVLGDRLLGAIFVALAVPLLTEPVIESGKRQQQRDDHLSWLLRRSGGEK